MSALNKGDLWRDGTDNGTRAVGRRQHLDWDGRQGVKVSRPGLAVKQKMVYPANALPVDEFVHADSVRGCISGVARVPQPFAE